MDGQNNRFFMEMRIAEEEAQQQIWAEADEEYYISSTM